MRFCSVVVSSLTALSVIACAVGANDADGEAELATGEPSTDAAPKPSTKPTADSAAPVLSDAEVESDAGVVGVDSGTLTDAASLVDAGDAGRVDGGNGGDGGVVAPGMCSGTSSCPAPLNAGAVSGDLGADVVSPTGSTSTWYVVTVTEDDASFTGAKLRVKATLTSPPGSNFDLYMYENAPTDCMTPTASSTLAAGVDTVSASWGEGAVANGVSDTKDIYIEVRHSSGTCAPASRWTLSIEGNK